MRPRATKYQLAFEKQPADLKNPGPLYLCCQSHNLSFFLFNTMASRPAPGVLCLEGLPRIQLDHEPLPLEGDHIWIVAAPEQFCSQTRCLCSHKMAVDRPVILLLLWFGLARGV